jgi:AcrR family transcriptional regulator
MVTGATPDRLAVRAAIIAATSELLVEGGPRAVTTRAVADRAGVQAPTIYRLFGDKEGLIEAVAERAMAEYVSTKAADDGDDADPLGALRIAWNRHIDFGLEHPDLYALIGARGDRPVSAATASGIKVLQARVHAVAAAGLLSVSEKRAVDMIHAAGNGALLALLQQPEVERDAALADAMFEAVLAAVTTGSAEVDSASRTLQTAIVQFGAVVDELPGLSAAEKSLMSEWIDRSMSESVAR